MISKPGLDAQTDRALASTRSRRLNPCDGEEALLPTAEDIARHLAVQFPDDLELAGRVVMATTELAATLSNNMLAVHGKRVNGVVLISILAFAAEQLVHEDAAKAGRDQGRG